MQSSDKYNAKRNLSAIIDFSNNINSNLNLEFALNNLLLTCFGKLAVTKGLLALYDENDILKISLSKGLKEEKIEKFPKIKRSDDLEIKLEGFVKSNSLVLKEEIISSDSLLGYLFLGEKLDKSEFTEEDKQFLSTILKIGSTTIRNSQNFESLNTLNKVLDAKINQLNSIFDLGKEFSSILEIKRVSKLLVYSISAQMLISKYAIIIYKANKPEILESKYNLKELEKILSDPEIEKFKDTVVIKEGSTFCEKCLKIGIALVVPMMIKSEKKGLLFLGKRITKQEYSKSDIEYIASIASFAIISIENSRLFKETIEKQKLEKDLETARSIQQNLLPKHLPKSDLYEISAINKTARQVGGDYYDVVELDENRLLIAIADVSGKGIQASLLMANLQAFLKSIYKQNLELYEASNFLNDLVSENTTNGSFITFFWGILDLSTRIFTYVNMGHNPPLLARDNKISKLQKGGMILGVMKTVIPYEYGELTMQQHDTLLLFTDGITEAMNIDSVEYSDGRLEELLLKIANFDPSKIEELLLRDVFSHTEGADQSDDITVVVLKIN